MHKLLRWLALSIGIVLAIIIAFTAGVHIASRQEPPYYRQALQQEPLKLAEAGDQLERRIFTLHNDTLRTGKWRATLTVNQINGWLASDLPEKFADVLPSQFQNPRVAIEEGKAYLACTYVNSPIRTVLSIEMDVDLTVKPNVIAFQIHRARAGALPIPLAQVTKSVSEVAVRADIDLVWTRYNNGVAAEVTIPDHREEMRRLVHLEALELRDGEVYLGGRTEIEEHVGEQQNDHNPRIGRAKEEPHPRK